MAVSGITKRALATALKELMEELPFSAISVSDICLRQNMNRKSFYYHFKDKYDLLNWIYDTEFLSVVREIKHQSAWDFMSLLLGHLSAERDFYGKALEVTGQNSFQEHFRELMEPVVLGLLMETWQRPVSDFQCAFFVDGIMLSLSQWLTAREEVAPEVYLERIKSCFTPADQ